MGFKVPSVIGRTIIVQNKLFTFFGVKVSSLFI
jgi:hypothetical protein